MTLTLREFRAKQLVKLKELEKELTTKYPDRAQRVKYIVDTLAAKLSQLRRFSLFSYLHILHLAAREFPEFETLMPTTTEFEKLLEGVEE